MQLNPTFRNKPLLTLITIVWATLAVAHTLFLIFLAQKPFSYALADSIIFNTLFVFLCLGMLYGQHFEARENPLVKSILSFYFPMVVIIETVWLITGTALVQAVIKNDQLILFLYDSIKYRAIVGFFLFSLVVMVFQTVKYYQNYQEKLLKSSRLETQLQRSKIDTLQMQMQPHFLFNALNSISSLTFDDAEKTREMIIRLSDFLRYTTKYSEKQLVRLNDELEHIDQYLSIERLRFGKRLNYYKNISENASERFLPCLVLQPIMENAIKHGVNQSVQPVTIELAAKIRNNKLLLEISNTKEGDSRKRGTGTGLKNLSNRLDLIYEGKANIQINNQTKRFTVKILIP